MTRDPQRDPADRRITSQDVARRAGVSQSAVSRVFTPGASASKATVEKVRKAAHDLGYRPNVLARSLITGRSKIIGLVVAYLDNQFYPDALQRLSIALQAEGYHILIFMASGSAMGDADGANEMERVIDELLDYQVDGIVTASVGISDMLTRRCEAAGIPIVLFNRGQDDPRLSEVTSDNRAGAGEIARFLVAGGHRRIAHISGWMGASTARERAAGFTTALDEAGVPLAAQIDGRFHRDVAAEAARALCDRADPPDAIFVGNDHMAFGVIDALRHGLGLRVPEDVSVVGYDDVPLAAWPSYELTTLRQSSGRMVKATVDTLLEHIADAETPPRKIRIGGRLVVRGSARIPEGDWT